jgi:hypothetical protein
MGCVTRDKGDFTPECAVKLACCTHMYRKCVTQEPNHEDADSEITKANNDNHSLILGLARPKRAGLAGRSGQEKTGRSVTY